MRYCSAWIQVFGLAVLGTALSSPADAQIYVRRSTSGVIEITNVPASADYRLIYPGKGTLIHSRGFRRSYKGEFDHHIQAAANLYGVAVDLIKAVIQVESEFDQRAVSSKGAQGLMQLMPFTSRRFGVFDAFDARQNIFGGVQYLRLLLDLFQGDVTLALAGYNAGENAVLRHKGVPPYRETRDYIQKIRGIISYAETSTLQSFTPTGRLNMAAGRSAAHIVPARPRIYYKYLDERGAAHFTHDPPAEGVTYIMLRAMD